MVLALSVLASPVRAQDVAPSVVAGIEAYNRGDILGAFCRRLGQRSRDQYVAATRDRLDHSVIAIAKRAAHVADGLHQ